MANTLSFMSTDGSKVNFETGWISAGETWTYASTTSFTAPGDVSGKYTKGDKIKLTQTTVKYFYVVGVSVSGDTTITVAGGSDYTLTNAAITEPHYSKAHTPSGFPTWFNWIPNYTGFSTDPTDTVSRFKIDGTAILVYHRESSTGQGISNASTFTVSLPVQAANISNATWENLNAVVDNGSLQADPGKAFVAAAGTSATIVKTLTGAGFTASGGKRITSFQIVYEY